MDKSTVSFLGFTRNTHSDKAEHESDCTRNGFELVPLRNLLTPLTSADEGIVKGRSYLPKNQDVRRCFFKHFRHSHLRPHYNTIRPIYTADDIKLTCNTRQLTSSHYYILDRETLILRPNYSNPVLFNPMKGIACIDKQHASFDIQTDTVNPFYLINEMVKDYVEEQLDAYKQQSQDGLGLEEFLSVCVYLPVCQNSLERQRQIYTYEKQILVADLFKAFNMDFDSMIKTDASALPPGTIIGQGRYKILSVIDSGGFSFTYRAMDMGSKENKEIAIKEFFIRDLHTRNNGIQVVSKLSSKIDLLKKARDKFWMESDKIKEFSHCPNIVKVYDLFDENGTCYYTMEYINGCDLFYYVKTQQGGSLTEDEALDIIRSVCKAVKAMHDGQMNHLDIKPENIMVEYETKRIILIDFGTAAQFDERESSLLDCYSNGYTPPEYLSVTCFCSQKDIYSIGATLYFLLSGEVPPSAFELMNGQSRLKRPKNVSEKTWNLVLRTMEYNYTDRPSSIEDLNL